jgi:hypothetical protein
VKIGFIKRKKEDDEQSEGVNRYWMHQQDYHFFPLLSNKCFLAGVGSGI